MPSAPPKQVVTATAPPPAISSNESVKSLLSTTESSKSAGSSDTPAAVGTAEHVEAVAIEAAKTKAKPAAKGAKKQKVEPTTPLEKGRDLAEKILKKVTRTTTLETQLSARPFAEKLLEEIKGDLKKFRCCVRIIILNIQP